MQLIREERGATAAEYALMIAFIAVLLAVGVGLLGDSIRPPLARVAAALKPGGGGGDDPAAAAGAAAAGAAGGGTAGAPAARQPAGTSGARQ